MRPFEDLDHAELIEATGKALAWLEALHPQSAAACDDLAVLVAEVNRRFRLVLAQVEDLRRSLPRPAIAGDDDDQPFDLIFEPSPN